MKFILLFLVISIVLGSQAFEIKPIIPTSTRGCRYIMGRCVEECAEGTHAYVSSCSAPTWSKKTCEEPGAHDMGAICDMSRCDCDDPTVLDEITGKCVKLEDCPKKD